MTLWALAGLALLATLVSFGLWWMGTWLFPEKDEPRLIDGIVVASIVATIVGGIATVLLVVGAIGNALIRAMT